MYTWNKINSKSDLPDYFNDVVYLYSCGSKGIGQLVWIDNQVRVVCNDGKVKPNYGYDIVAWLDIPVYKG